MKPRGPDGIACTSTTASRNDSCVRSEQEDGGAALGAAITLARRCQCAYWLSAGPISKRFHNPRLGWMFRVLHLHPIRRCAGAIGAVAVFRHQTLKPEFAGFSGTAPCRTPAIRPPRVQVHPDEWIERAPPGARGLDRLPPYVVGGDTRIRRTFLLKVGAESERRAVVVIHYGLEQRAIGHEDGCHEFR